MHTATPSYSYRLIRAGLDVLARLYFREVAVVGREHIPFDRGCVIVSWHPNGLVDPCLILTQFPRQVVFGARHGLFRWPLLGPLLRSVGTVPIYRASDLPAEADAARRRANRDSLDVLAAALAGGSCAALFPEGRSHDEPHLVELKTGIARLYYRARELQPEGALPPAIIPVGLHYNEKHLFRSRALVWFHHPLVLPPHLDVRPVSGEEQEVARPRVQDLTALIEQVLNEVVHGTADWQTHHILHRGRKLVRAERARRAGAESHVPDIEERTLGFARLRAGYYACLRSNPERVTPLEARARRYDADLRALGLDDHELDRDPRLASPWLFIILLLQVVLVFFLFPPLLLAGYVINGPAVLLLLFLCRLIARDQKDEASIKLIGGAVLFPLTWIGAGLMTAIGYGYLHAFFPALPNHLALAGFIVALLGAVGAAVSLRYQHLAAETLHAVQVRLTRKRRSASIDRLRSERSAIFEELMTLGVGLDLPGVVAADGTIRWG